MKSAAALCFRLIWVLAAASLSSSCVPDLDLPDNVAIKVQLSFVGFHDEVSATWSGMMVATNWEELGTGDTSAGASLPGNVDVVPPMTVDFPIQDDLFPGIWNITVRAFEGSDLFLEVTCENLDIGNDLLFIGVHTVQVFENGSCDAQAGDIRPPIPPDRDVETISIELPATATFGDLINVPVRVRNNSQQQENVSVELTYRSPSGGNPVPIGTASQFVNSSAIGTINLEWDTSCLSPAGDYLIEATALIPNDSTANNSQSGVTNLSVDRELSVVDLAGPSTISSSASGGSPYSFEVVNAKSVAEPGIDITVADSFSRQGTVQQFWTNPVDIACGERKELTFVYFPSTLISPPEQGSLTVSVATAVPGDDPADNSDTITVDLAP